MTFYNFVGGTTAVADEVDANFNFVTLTSLNTRWNEYLTGATPSVTGYSSLATNGFKYLDVVNSGQSSEYDTTNSTAYYNKNNNGLRFVAFSTVIDWCDDSSIDTNYWTVDDNGGMTIDENTVRLYFQITSNSPAESFISLDGASAPDFEGTDGEFVFFCNAFTNGAVAARDMYVKAYLTDGSTDVEIGDIFDITNGGDFDEERIVFLSYNGSAETASLYLYDGSSVTTVATGVDCSSLASNVYLKLGVDGSNGSSTAGTLPRFSLYGISYRQDGVTTGNCDFVTASTTAPANAGSIFVNYELDTTDDLPDSFSDGSSSGTCDDSTYASGDATRTWQETGVAGTTVKFRIRESDLSVDPSGISTAILKNVRGFYE